MFNSSMAQPKIIGDLKAVLEGIGLNPLLPGEVQEAIEGGLELIAKHQQKPQRFKEALNKARDSILAMPMSELEALGKDYIDDTSVDSIDARERMHFAASMGGIERVTEDNADAFIKTNPESWKVWKESAKFWMTELS